MNVLFLTLIGFSSLNERNIYTDLLREFTKNGHNVYAISPLEKKEGCNTCLITEDKASILRLKIGNIQKTSLIEKCISTLTIESIFRNAIAHYYSDIKFDLVIYSTPPITLLGAIEYVKQRDNAKTYLLLKDIFPQNAVDIGMIKKTGLKGLIYKYFRAKEKKLYQITDRIGCMSQANADFILRENSEIDSRKVELCPNSIDIIDRRVDEEEKRKTRQKYNLPLKEKVFVYGGNLGKPQGIPFVIECLKMCAEIEEAFFLVVGDGTEYKKLEEYTKQSQQKNLKLLRRIPKDDYDSLVRACDVGMIFLDHRFTIPNFPSRLLCYMQARIPVLAATDINTDIGDVIVKGGFGWWCESNSPQKFQAIVKESIKQDLSLLGERAFLKLKSDYSVKQSYMKIMEPYL